ncbi:hypothetical protein C8R45DRAFT_918062 [Mycena sanguinolenta]|nr:hypothetical protein C8R45DRAFT_918062 [Mycena sanguinolenta]
MSNIPETSFSVLAQCNSTATPWGLLSIGVVGATIYYTSPLRLTRVLIAALADTEKKHLAAVENGVFCVSTDVDVAERLALLQLKASTLHETSLRSSLTPLSTLYDMFNLRRSVTVLRCLGEVRRIGTFIEVRKSWKYLKDAQGVRSAKLPPSRTVNALSRIALVFISVDATFLLVGLSGSVSLDANRLGMSQIRLVAATAFYYASPTHLMATLSEINI